jgi:hypothetical protein
MDIVLSAVALAFLAVLVGLAAVVFRSKDYYQSQIEQLQGVRQDLAVVCADVDFLFCRLAEVERLLHNHSVLGSVETSSVKDWVSSAHAVLDDVNSRLADMQSQV